MNQTLLLIGILIVCVILFLPIVLNSKEVENFYAGYIPNLRYPYYNNPHYFRYPYSRYPLRNITRSTRNMSYDLRGDVPISYTYVGPWNNSSLSPVVNKNLWMVS